MELVLFDMNFHHRDGSHYDFFFNLPVALGGPYNDLSVKYH
jgi:hypothetical protein